MYVVISKGISDDHISTCGSIQFAFGVVLNPFVFLHISWFSWCMLLKWWSSALYRVCWMLWRNLMPPSLGWLNLVQVDAETLLEVFVSNIFCTVCLFMKLR